MTLEFPDLKTQGCRHFVACARVVTEDKALSKWLEQDRTFAASYNKGGTRHYVRMMTGKGEKDHFHLEVAAKSYFSGGHPPKILHKIEEIRACADKLWDNKMEVWCKATYETAYNDQPERGLIKALSFENTIGAISMRLNSGTLIITGAPVQRISWSRSVKTEQCAITIDAGLGSVLNANYLTQLFTTMGTFLDNIIFGKSFAALEAK